MDSEFRRPRTRWGELLDGAVTWRRLHLDGQLQPWLWTAIRPHVEFFERVSSARLSWKHRLYILIHGRLPDDL